MDPVIGNFRPVTSDIYGAVSINVEYIYYFRRFTPREVIAQYTQ